MDCLAFFCQAFQKMYQPQRRRRIEEYYDPLNVIGQGGYGVIYRMRDKRTGEVVAVKEEFDGWSDSALSEIYILNSLPRHPSIVGYKEAIKDDCGRVFVAMEYLDTDLNRFLQETKEPLTLREIKLMMKQILEGVKFLHDNGIMHRDLKPANILMNNDRAQVKICDFGLSRHVMSQSGRYSPGVVTLWYRAPELLVGLDSYWSAIDMWSVGCIMAELLSNEVLFKGNSEIHQLSCIYGIIGGQTNFLRKKFAPILTASGYDLLERLLELNPHKRITTEDALDHKWFREYYSFSV